MIRRTLAPMMGVALLVVLGSAANANAFSLLGRAMGGGCGHAANYGCEPSCGIAHDVCAPACCKPKRCRSKLFNRRPKCCAPVCEPACGCAAPVCEPSCGCAPACDPCCQPKCRKQRCKRVRRCRPKCCAPACEPSCGYAAPSCCG